MAGIIYTAASRAPLVTDSPAHTAGSEYSIDIKLRAYSESIEMPKSVHTSLAAITETVLQRASKVLSITLIWDNALNNDMEEFLFSIAAGEIFSFDAYGTIAAPVNAVDVVCVNDSFDLGRMTHGDTPWRSVSLLLRPAG